MKNKKIFFLVSTFLILFCFTLALSRERVGLGFSKGDQYFHRLQTWYTLATQNNWTEADQLEKQLDLADTLVYKSTHRPEELKKIVNTLTLKSNKSVEDWLELARIQTILGKTDDAYISISTAKTLDPIRDDIGQIYYRTSK